MKKMFAYIGLGIALLSSPSVHANTMMDEFGSEEIFAAPITLNPSVSVESEYIRLGDIFTGNFKNPQKAVAYSPAPGKRAVFDADWLYRTARKYDIDWKPITARDHVVVSRASRVIEAEDIKKVIRSELLSSGVNESSEIVLNNRLMTLHIPSAANPNIEVLDIEYNDRLDRFSSKIEIMTNTPDARQVRVEGRVFETSEIPVLRKNLSPGDIISKNDIEWITVRNDRMRRDIILDPRDLIGKEAKRMVKAGSMIQGNEIRTPIVIEKGKMVTMKLTTSFMKLTARGKALEDGSAGEVIRIRNLQSNSTVRGVVDAAGFVTIMSNNSSLAMR